MFSWLANWCYRHLLRGNVCWQEYCDLLFNTWISTYHNVLGRICIRTIIIVGMPGKGQDGGDEHADPEDAEEAISPRTSLSGSLLAQGAPPVSSAPSNTAWSGTVVNSLMGPPPRPPPMPTTPVLQKRSPMGSLVIDTAADHLDSVVESVEQNDGLSNITVGLNRSFTPEPGAGEKLADLMASARLKSATPLAGWWQETDEEKEVRLSRAAARAGGKRPLPPSSLPAWRYVSPRVTNEFVQTPSPKASVS